MQQRKASELTEVDISRLAREIARDIRPLTVILEALGIDLDQYDRLQSMEMFQKRLSEEAQLWSGSTKAGLRERVATKAVIAIEELLEEAILIVQNTDIPGAARVQALQFIAKLGHLGESGMTQDDGSGRVQINIMIGGKPITFDKEIEPKVIEGEVVTSEVTP